MIREAKEGLVHAARRALGWLRQLLAAGRDEPLLRCAIDMRDPLGGALHDADLLVTFAAQSSRPIPIEHIIELAHAAAAVEAARKAGPVVPERLARFWKAYDALNQQISPLSAHSIRSSLELNATAFPSSLFRGLGGYALLAVFVFLVSVAVQVFWVAGKDLVERMEALEKERLEVNQKLAANDAALRRRENTLAVKLCDLKPARECLASVPVMPFATLTAAGADARRQSGVAGEIAAVLQDVNDRRATEQELVQQLHVLNRRSRPLQEGLAQWRARADIFCGAMNFNFLCPVPQVPDWQNEQAGAIAAIALARKALEDAQADGPAAALRVAGAPQPIDAAVRRQWLVEKRQRELLGFERKLVELEGEWVRSMVVEPRTFIANIATYLIPMCMGILGALTYILRRGSLELRDHTYVPVSTSISVVRICLGAIAGVFGGLVVPSADEMVLKAMPPLFVPFLFGYGIEIMFSVLDGLVNKFPPPAAPAAKTAAPS